MLRRMLNVDDYDEEVVMPQSGLLHGWRGRAAVRPRC